MSPATQQTEVRLVFHGCRLGRSELDRLFSLAPEGIPSAYTAVSTQRDNTRYTADDMSALIDALNEANAPGDLHTWDNLMQVAGDAEGDRKVSLDIAQGRVVVQISGRDATWAYGQGARIQLLLEAAGGKEPGPGLVKMIDDMKWSTLWLLASLGVCLVSGSYVADPDSLFRTEQWRASAGVLAGLVVWGVFALIAASIVSRANRPLLLPTTEVPRGSWWNRASSTDRIALGGLVVAALSLIVAAVALGNELVGDDEKPTSGGTTATR
ncbi:hypothetical protein ACIQU3_15795 [Streptomyces sp. NPDC101110]|uniref:hypothetical protein n=1 Tax=unclassified Streptomyces TaxID=2593676 RepID=UPI00382DBD11